MPATLAQLYHLKPHILHPRRKNRAQKPLNIRFVETRHVIPSLQTLTLCLNCQGLSSVTSRLAIGRPFMVFLAGKLEVEED